MIYLSVPLQMLHCFLWFFPYFWFARQVKNRGKWFFLAPVVVEFPVYLARTVLPYFVIDATLISYLQYAMLMDVIYNAIRAFVLIMIARLMKRRSNGRLGLFDLKLRGARIFAKSGWVGFLFFFSGVACLLYLAYSSRLGILGWLADPRDGYQYDRFGKGQWWVLSQVFLGVSLFFFTFNATSRKQIVFYAALVGGATYFLGSKALLLNIAVYIFGLWQYRFGLSFFGVFTFFAISFGSMLSLFFSGFSGGLAQAALQIQNYFNYYLDGAKYYQAYFSGALPLYHGSIYFGNLWVWVPRFLWPSKPVVYGDLLIVDYFYPGAPAQGFTPAFWGRVDEYADFGFPGMVFFAFFDIAFITWCIFAFYAVKLFNDKSRPIGRGLFVLLLVITPNLWLYVKGPNVIVVTLLIIVVVKAMSKVRVFSSGRDVPHKLGGAASGSLAYPTAGNGETSGIR